VVAAVLLLGPGSSGLLAAGVAASPGSPMAGHGLPTVAASRPSSDGGVASSSPAVPPLNVSPLFFSNDWSVGNSSPANVTCSSPIGWCYDMSQNPNLLQLANGDLGLGFSAITNFTSAPSCSTSANVSTRIAWSTSSDGGKSFAPMEYIGNNGSSGCPYFEGLEPSFAVGGSGEIFGAFVATNATPGQIFTSTAPGAFGSGRPVLDYLYRPYAALALISSTTNGTNWSSTKLLIDDGNIAMPRIATFGDSVYIVYTNITNSSAPITGSNTDSTSLQFVYSTDNGSTWSGPVTIPSGLPGANAAMNFNAMDPSISVSSGGKIAVAYAADRNCVVFCAVGNSVYSDDIVVSMSTTNGSSWAKPTIVSVNATEFGYATANYGGPGLWEGALDTSLQWSTSSDLYVAWSQSEDMNLTDQYAGQLDFANSGIFAAASTNGGSTWTTSSVTGALPALDYNQEVFGFGYFNPALGVHNGTVYLAYSFYNWTNGGTGRNAYTQNAYGDGNGEWMTSSSNGVTWNSPSIIEEDPAGTGITDFDYWGYLGSVSFDSHGNPVVAYALQTAFLSFTTTISLPVALVVGTVYSGSTTTVTIEETGLPSGTLWSAQISGTTYSTTATEFNITNAPLGRPFYVVWPGPVVLTAYRTAFMPEIGTAPILVATGPTVDIFSFTTFYGIQFFANPTNTPGLTIESADFNQNGGYQFYWYWAAQVYAFGSYYYSYGAAFPWYFPAGTWLNFSSGYSGNNYYYGAGFVGYWSGTGAGHFNGSASVAPIQVNGPINETAWMAAYGVYSESVAAPSLPSNSTYSFSMNGGTYTGTGGSTVVVPNLGTGAYEIVNISATSTRIGWSYFGYSDNGNPVVIPNIPAVNLSFAQVDVGAAAGVVSFNAVGIPSGSDWQLSFNGTEYSSTTPWINVTTRPGNFPVQSYPTLAAAGNQTFVPTGIGSGGSVVVGQTYDVNFTSTYKVQLEESAGGTLSKAVGSYFLAPGATLEVNATPTVGYRFAGWTGTGPGSVTSTIETANLTANGPIVETASFLPLVLDRFNVTINETGVPNGTAWTVVVGGVGYSSLSSQLVIPNEFSCTYSGSLGRYSVAVPFSHANGTGVRYVPTSASQTVCGGGATATIQFETEYSVVVAAGTGGVVQVTASSGGSTSSPYWVPSGGSVALLASALNGYEFSVWVGTGTGSYSGPLSATTLDPISAPVTEIAEFTPLSPVVAPRYTATFVASLLFLAGTSWTISNATASMSSTSADIVVTGLASGTYSFTVGAAIAPTGTTRYVPISTTVTVTVHANTSQPVPFASQYRLSVSSVGPGTATPSSEWAASGAPVSLSAAPGVGANFLGWAGTGVGSYTGPNENATISVSGPLTEIASFANAPPSVTTTTGSSSGPWSNPIVWVGLGLVGLVIGVAIGVVVARGRQPPPPAREDPRSDVATDSSEPPVYAQGAPEEASP